MTAGKSGSSAAGAGFPIGCPSKWRFPLTTERPGRLSLPQLDQPAADFTAQPITSAFRGPDGAMYFAMDGAKATAAFCGAARTMEFTGTTWAGAPAAGTRRLFRWMTRAICFPSAAKTRSVDGWSPRESLDKLGRDAGATSVTRHFPPLGSGQRPSLIRLADGHLFFVSDAYSEQGQQSAARRLEIRRRVFRRDLHQQRRRRGTSSRCRCNCRTTSAAPTARSATSPRGRRRTA